MSECTQLGTSGFVVGLPPKSSKDSRGSGWCLLWCGLWCCCCCLPHRWCAVHRLWVLWLQLPGLWHWKSLQWICRWEWFLRGELAGFTKNPSKLILVFVCVSGYRLPAVSSDVLQGSQLCLCRLSKAGLEHHVLSSAGQMSSEHTAPPSPLCWNAVVALEGLWCQCPGVAQCQKAAFCGCWWFQCLHQVLGLS